MIPINLKRIARKIAGKPRLSLVVIVYKMPEQARNTLISLSTDYQKGVFEEEYEVIVVENASDRPMGKAGIEGLSGNFRYYYREETLPTPVFAVNFGAEKARGAHIAIMIDGARVATPGMIRAILQASRISKKAIVSVPGYHLGKMVQQEAMNSGYNEETEKTLMKSINWPRDGYRLFDIGCFSATSQSGFFQPIGESNCFTVPRAIWKQTGGIDLRFTETGGGQANLDFYKRVCELPGTELVLLAGEGTFHQFHGGVTTGQKKEIRDKTMQDHFDQYKSIRGEYYRAPIKKALIFGSIPVNALRYMEHSVKKTQEKLEKSKRS